MAASAADGFVHRIVQVGGLSLHVVESAPDAPERPAILLLHGWPEDWSAFQQLMALLPGEFRVVALDLPGIGRSLTPAPASDKRSLARHVRSLVGALGLRDLTLVGHDVGGQIVYAYLRAYPDDLRRAAILNVAVPGVEPWPKLRTNPSLWHFGFHAVPELPEQIVTGRQKEYFAYFYDRIAAHPGAVTEAARRAYVEAYARPEALRAGFDWYRAFPRDEQDNLELAKEAVRVPVLYIRGAAEAGLGLEEYLAGFRASRLERIHGELIAECGHFSPDEQPAQLAGRLERFARAG